MKQIKIFAIALTALFATSCSDDDSTTAIPVNEQEAISTIRATFTPVGGGATITLTSRDLDGDGPNPPVNTISGPFAAGVTYSGSVQFQNELAGTIEDVTLEIEEEGDHHQLFFVQTGGNLGTFTYNDADEDGKPIGLSFIYNAAAAATAGQLQMVLIHHPNKDAAGVAQGDITNAGGSTDAEVTFSVSVN